MTDKKFTASLDLTAKLITGFVTALFLFIIVNAVRQISATAPEGAAFWGPVAAVVMVIGIYVTSWLLAPTGYLVSKGNLVIQRRVRDVIIPLDSNPVCNAAFC